MYFLVLLIRYMLLPRKPGCFHGRRFSPKPYRKMASWETYTNDTEEKTMILQTLKEKIHVVSFLLLHPASFYIILIIFTPRRKGSDPHSHHKRKFAHEEADSDRLREAVFGKGLQADHAGGNQRKGRCVFQPVLEHFPRQGRRIDGAGGVHV